MLDGICRATQWPYGEAWVPDAGETSLRLSSAWHGEDDILAALHAVGESVSLARGESLTGVVWETLEPQWTPDVAAVDPSLHPRAELVRAAGLRSVCGIPVAADDTLYAVLIFCTPGPRDVESLLVEIVSAVAAQLGVVFRRRKAEEALRNSNAELESFTYTVSHDLRGPLRSMDGFSAALLEDYGDELDEVATDYLRRIRAASTTMSQLIDALLDFSRLSRRELAPELVDLTVLAEEVVLDLRQAEPGRSVDISISPGLSAHGDRRLLRLVLQNLIGNAWKFTARTRNAAIEFGLMDGGDGTAFFVRDNGAGFDMAYADKLFAPFQRLHGTREYRGTGIGLASVARIIHRHAGKVWAEGAVGRGATVYFTL